MPNFILEKEHKDIKERLIKEYIKKQNNNRQNEKHIGIYVDNDEWYTNIYNTISTLVFIKNSVLNYNLLNDRFLEFMKIYDIKSNPSIFSYASIERTMKEFLKNDIILDFKFTNNFSYNFLLSAELQIPVAIGNTTDYFENCNNDYLKNTIVVNAEDNPDMNKGIIENILNNKEKIKENLKIWKEKYNNIAKENLQKMVKE